MNLAHSDDIYTGTKWLLNNKFLYYKFDQNSVEPNAKVSIE